ncbi:hypothetical protein [Coleofasciculus sp. FACHB-T130]|uniref:hypothetical protein n=1 Tax=Cyanophyceae TaxID=3028117 RepID=UPI00168937C6|nr:hypothetical protein [Coleofasciculus sp. FACHB-T130]MBD1879859.1 hypothetical protein [Coleofasciculus sp. FACHB-T130]
MYLLVGEVILLRRDRTHQAKCERTARSAIALFPHKQDRLAIMLSHPVRGDLIQQLQQEIETFLSLKSVQNQLTPL